MPEYLVKLPNDTYGTWSSVSDEFTSWGLNRQELWDDYRDDAIRRAAHEFERKMTLVEERRTSDMIHGRGQDPIRQYVELRDAQHGTMVNEHNQDEESRAEYLAFLADLREQYGLPTPTVAGPSHEDED